AQLSPGRVLDGAYPRLVDEWQDAPVLWDKARRIIDDSPGKGLFIFTGSAVPPRQATSHSGTGRFAVLRMRPMSLFELGESSGVVSLAGLFGGAIIDPDSAHSGLDFDKALNLICRGGWPGSFNSSDSAALKVPQAYLRLVAESDVSAVDGVRRDPGKVTAVLRSLGRNVGTFAKATTIHSDVLAQDGNQVEVSMGSVRAYLAALERIFVIDNLPPWRYSLRSKSQLTLSPKRYLADPSLAAAAIRATPATLARDTKTAGFLFEAMCVRDLRVYAQTSGFEVSQYHDNKDLEADAVVEGPSGTWGAVDIKMSWQQADTAAKTLFRLKNKLKGEMGEPSFLMILTATGGVAHTRPDGIHVVPLDCLGP
ncbi:MAG: DUF4143 domain-containing protein, partial [Micrococcales bacterium]|nr:DUF4143 domain-containing protein [Micrococcales bacterium]